MFLKKAYTIQKDERHVLSFLKVDFILKNFVWLKNCLTFEQNHYPPN